MTRDLLRFNAMAGEPANDRDVSLGEWLAVNRFGAAFRDNYICALAGTIWSATPAEMLRFPAATLLTFFRNHSLLSATDRVQWWTVDGGSREYVQRIEARLRARGATIRLGAPVRAVSRGDGAIVVTDGHGPEHFDAVVLACHSSQALALLTDASASERRVLGAMTYTKGRIVLHDDARQMPTRRKCWSAWNVRRRGTDASVTYWMNRLQSIPEDVPLFATLNPLDAIPDEHVFDVKEFEHPMFDRAAIAAQAQLPTLQGLNDTYFCGAYARYGFHEDGLMSAVRAVSGLAAAPAWAAGA
jgi:predicted NAD/FAD-binding protein